RRRRRWRGYGPFPTGRRAPRINPRAEQPRQLRARRDPGSALACGEKARLLRHAGRTRAADMIQIARYLGRDGEILEGVVSGDEIEEISGLDPMLRGGRRVGGKRKLAGVQFLP